LLKYRKERRKWRFCSRRRAKRGAEKKGREWGGGASATSFTSEQGRKEEGRVWLSAKGRGGKTKGGAAVDSSSPAQRREGRFPSIFLNRKWENHEKRKRGGEPASPIQKGGRKRKHADSSIAG